jgi:tetratricopeptide (TPR) repeat protein
MSGSSEKVVLVAGRGARHTLAALGLLIATACASNPPPAAEEPPPPLDDSGSDGGGQVAKASSSAVQDGINAIHSQDFEKAKQILSEAHGANPSDPQAAFYLGVALENTDDLDGAVTSYKKALENDPKLMEASINLSAILLEREDYAGALEVVDAALGSGGKHALLLTNRAIALAGSGKSDEALEAYKTAVEASPDDLQLRFGYAQLLAQAGQSGAAVSQLKEVVKSSDPAVVGAAANVLGRLGAFAECIAGLDRALKEKEDADLHVRRGVCRHGMKDNAGAQKDYEAAIGVDANFAPAHYYLGRHLKAAGKKKQAKDHLTKAVELGKGSPIEKAAADALKGL